MTDSVVLEIAARLREEIPAPVRPKPKPRKTWRKLRPGDFLVDPEGKMWWCTAVDSGGAELRQLVDEVATHSTMRLEDGGWADGGWVKMKRPRRQG